MVYLSLDGFYLGVRRDSLEKLGVLVVHGIDRPGESLTPHLSLGGRESTSTWTAALHDLVEGGLRPPQLIISDGEPELLRAVSGLWPEVPR